jgi:hypothetical protein
MTSNVIAEIELQNLMTGQYVPASLCEGISEEHLEGVEKKWMPALREIATEISRECKAADGAFDSHLYLEKLGSMDLQDAHWDWRQKIEVWEGNSAIRHFAIECDSIPQALMSVDLIQRSRLEETHGQHIVYVDYLSVAPWNRPNFTEDRLFRGIGTSLIMTAISLSIDEGFNGRIGLHSLPQAERFYRDNCGMIDCGQDPAKSDLVYFEMTAVKAQEFLNP